jgi:adenosylhomocysteine nucleosidase
MRQNITNSGIITYEGQTKVNQSAVGPGAQVTLGRSAESVTARPASVGVITVLSEEANAVREVLDLHRVRKGELPFMEGHVDARGRNVHIAATRTLKMGPRSTMATFQQLREHYSPAVIALTGIGGGIHPDAAIGDVVITNRVIYYDQRRETPGGPRHRGEMLEAPAAIGHALNSYFTDYAEPAVLDDEETGDQYRVHTGPIGSGDAVITDSDSHIVRYLADFNEHTRAIDMEGAGLSEAFHEQTGKRPVRGWVIIRGISDDASEYRNYDHHQLAARRAAQVLRTLLPYLPIDDATHG